MQNVQPVNFTGDTLTNGMRVLLAPDDAATGVAVHLALDAGSRNEQPEQAGLATLLQKIVYKKLHQGDNAFSPTHQGNLPHIEGIINPERTSFFCEFVAEPAANLLEGVLSTLAHAMNQEIQQGLFDEQRLALLEECRQQEKRPFGKVQEALLSLLFNDFAHQYGVICALPTLDPLSLNDALSFLKTYYVPHHAVLVVTGKFRGPAVEKIVEDHFGPIPGPRVPPEGTLSLGLAVGLGQRQTIRETQADAPYYMSAYLTVPGNHLDWYALNVLADILGQGDTARLYQALVANHLASSVPEGMTESRGPSLLYVGAKLLPGVQVEAAEALMDAEMARIQQDGVTEAEVEKARVQEGEYSATQRASLSGRAAFLARGALYYHDPDRINTELGQMLAVTAQDVQRVAQTYLLPTNRAVVIAMP